MLPTPSTTHLSFDTIYEPAEDSYLFLDTLSSDSESQFLTSHFSSSPTPLIVEVGTGSGVVLAFITAHSKHILGRNDVLSLGTDLNWNACKGASETITTAVRDQIHESNPQKNLSPSPSPKTDTPKFTATLTADLTSPLRTGAIDILLFNPPYVPTPTLPSPPSSLPSTTLTYDQESHLLSLSYAGGLDGMETTNRLIESIPSALSERGIAYVLLCAQNRPAEVIARIEAWEQRWKAEIVGRSGKVAGWEKLVILRIWRAI